MPPCHQRLFVCVLLLASLLRAWRPGGGGCAVLLVGSSETIRISRTGGPITIDGDLSDEGWRDATRVEKWYEANPGDNTEPKVQNVGYLTYDDRFFYAAFEFEDPNPGAIRAPFADRDNIGSSTDYGGIILDTRNDGKTATFFVVTPRNIQYDAITDDASGEDSSPDFFWESAARITARGWTLEMRIPFSSLRYKNVDPQTWGILLYRNYPRDRHYQFFSAKLPRGGNCFICRSNTLVGMEHLPAGGHLVAAPYVSAKERDRAPRGGVLGTPLVNAPVKPHVGLDVKYTPNADNAIDLTVKPDFSQVESDTAQISANERFALFFPEKRPFFLEGVDLFQTPIQAVYTRTITAPVWGGRVTGKEGGIRYTVLVADDAGGGSAILPGPNGSSLASVDEGSTVFVARAKRDIGLSFIGVLATDREAHDGEQAHNRVLGPDFQWRPKATRSSPAKWLYSARQTPEPSGSGGRVDGAVALADTPHPAVESQHDALRLRSVAKRTLATDFRADNGFVPQVGYREMRQRRVDIQAQAVPRAAAHVRQRRLPGRSLGRAHQPSALTSGFGMDTRWGGFMQFRAINDDTRAGHRVTAAPSSATSCSSARRGG